MFEITNLDQVFKQIDAWEAKIYEDTRQAARGLSVKLFKGFVKRSAQYSGDFAANWKYSLNAPDLTFTENAIPMQSAKWSGDLDKGPPGVVARIMGHPAAITYAHSANRGRDSQFKLGDTIYIANSAHHDVPYAWQIEENKIKFRAGNKGAPIRRTLEADIGIRYAVIRDRQVAELKEEKL